jgi:hypothetical protein
LTCHDCFSVRYLVCSADTCLMMLHTSFSVAAVSMDHELTPLSREHLWMICKQDIEVLPLEHKVAYSGLVEPPNISPTETSKQISATPVTRRCAVLCRQAAWAANRFISAWAAETRPRKQWHLSGWLIWLRGLSSSRSSRRLMESSGVAGHSCQSASSAALPAE